MEKSDDKVVSLTATGDILLHGRVYGGTRKRKDFTFDEQLGGAKDLLGQTDLTMVNLETLIAGTEFGLSGFPRFNGPKEIGQTLKNMGVDILNIANNHALDKGEEGLLKSIENIEKLNLEYVGAHKSKKDYERLRIIEKNGLKICFVSYTNSTNGINPAKDKEYLVNSMGHIRLIEICRLLRKVKSEDLADIIVVNMHFGEEYHLEPSASQREVARSLSDAGANVIIGHHPHVIQPPEWIENSRGGKTFVAYSLGNFFSGQNGLYRQIGCVFTCEILKPSTHYDEVIIKKPKIDLTFVSQTERLRYDLYKFKDWKEINDEIITKEGKFNSKLIYEKVCTRLASRMVDLEVS